MKPGQWLSPQVKTQARFARETGASLAWVSETPDASRQDFPPQPELTYWWTCYRKIRFASEAQAERVAREKTEGTLTTKPYSCSYCAAWHLGRLAGEHGGQANSYSMLKRQWRRQRDKPSLEQLTEAFRDPKATAGRVWGERPDQA